MIDIANARALVETLKDYAEHPSSFTDISPTEADAAADLIAALLDERDALARDAARYRWLRQPNPLHREAHIAVLTHNGGWVASEEKADAAIDLAMKGASDES